jgi:polysaccharide export outer membrane protein
VHLAGLELAEAEAAITAAAIQRNLYKNPNITVTMKHQRVNHVTVVGAVKEPGVHLIPRGQSDLLAALVAAGGLAENAGTNVEIRNPLRETRPPDRIASTAGGVNPVGHSIPGRETGNIAPAQRSSIKVDLVSATKAGTGGYVVEDGAVVMVEKRDPEPVHVLGLVQKPNRYEFPIGEDLRLTDAVALAGGVSSPVANKIFVIRKKPDSAQTAIVEVKLSDAKRDAKYNLLLSPGDAVSVEQTPMTVLIDTMRIINFGFGASLPLTTLF